MQELVEGDWLLIGQVNPSLLLDLWKCCSYYNALFLYQGSGHVLTEIKKLKFMSLSPFFKSNTSRWYVASSNTFFVALKCVSGCIAADTVLSNNNFINLAYIM